MTLNNVSSDLIRGNIDTIILCVLCQKDNYGYEIIKAIKENSNDEYELKEPTLYSSLKRLEGQKMVESYWGNESQGGRRKYYRITDEGLQMYKRNYEAWKVARQVIDKLIEIR
ncbi:PadR family transcriptional regulator [Clostridium tagluense]|uniref:PadR family transcriptional regulator n=1 Tax=Clostridium tagluense TaxID=360422 RepID=A0A401UMK8_9CLOT|nr:PadR family transcriptional regulator [Clostridium tagluense]GCD10770.1 PadR family transcriptional regulator [Clostridium tagluense]